MYVVITKREIMDGSTGLGEHSMKNSAHTVSASVSKQIVSDKAVKVLASSIFRQLQDEGCAPRDIISISSQLIDLVTHELQRDGSHAPA